MSSLPVLTNRSTEANTIEVLMVSPNAKLREQLRDRLSAERWNLKEVTSGAEAIEFLHEYPCEILLVDPVLPDLEFTEFSAMVSQRFPDVQILTLNAQTGHLLLGSMSPTAYSSQLAETLHVQHHAPVQSIADRRLTSGPAAQGLRGVIGDSDVMQRVYELTHMVASRDTTVLITGSSGTGKDLIAQAIHLISPRRKQPFVVINCAAIPESLLEAELFGYTKGSFTGAVQARTGRIHAAHGGTLFLDEIGDMPLSLQSKILRFLEQGEVQRIGGNDNLKVDVRVVAATNAALEEAVRQKVFREDLYYRLAIFPIRLPALGERHGDVPKLAIAFAERFCPGVTISQAAMQILDQHTWPGNVRELRNVMERCSILVGDEREILPHHVLI